jgi:hypothetical protein
MIVQVDQFVDYPGQSHQNAGALFAPVVDFVKGAAKDTPDISLLEWR